MLEQEQCMDKERKAGADGRASCCGLQWKEAQGLRWDGHDGTGRTVLQSAAAAPDRRQGCGKHALVGSKQAEDILAANTAAPAYPPTKTLVRIHPSTCTPAESGCSNGAHRAPYEGTPPAKAFAPLPNPPKSPPNHSKHRTPQAIYPNVANTAHASHTSRFLAAPTPPAQPHTHLTCCKYAVCCSLSHPNPTPPHPHPTAPQPHTTPPHRFPVCIIMLLPLVRQLHLHVPDGPIPRVPHRHPRKQLLPCAACQYRRQARQAEAVVAAWLP